MSKIKDKIIEDKRLREIDDNFFLEREEESYFINQCSSDTLINKEFNEYGFVNTYKVGDKKVVLSFQCYQNGGDDFDEELVNVSVTDYNSK